MGSVSFIAEYQENLNVIQIVFDGIGGSSDGDLFLETETCSQTLNTRLEEAVVKSTRDPSLALRIFLPFTVCPGQKIPLVQQSFFFEAKLSAVPPIGMNHNLAMNNVVNHPLSASHLRDLRPLAFCCSHCDCKIVNILPNVVFQDLPSEHWAEMMEVWMCHAYPSFTARLAQQAVEGFWPSKEAILVGGSYILVNEAHARKENISTGVSKVSSCESLRNFHRWATRRSSPLPNWWSYDRNCKRSCRCRKSLARDVLPLVTELLWKRMTGGQSSYG